MVHHMVRCKIKGTGKKRCLEDDDDQDFNFDHGSGTRNKNSSGEEFNRKTGGRTKKRVSLPVGAFESPSADSKDTLSDLEDGDLLFFDGIPFHFLSPKLDVASLNDTSGPAPDTDIEALPLLLPPTFPLLESDVDLQPIGDMSEPDISSYGIAIPRRYPRSIILDETYNSFRNSSESIQNSYSNVGIDRPQPNDSTILGVFDHHFYDIHAPGTMSMCRYNNNSYQMGKHHTVSVSNPSVALMDSWANFRHKEAHVTAK